MNFDVKRIYVEKREGFNTEALNLLSSLKENLNIDKLTGLRILNMYTVGHLDEEDFKSCVSTVFSEPNQDKVYFEELDLDGHVFAIEYLPGQYDQRADFAAQCVQIVTGKEKPPIKYAKVFVLEGDLSQGDIDKIKNYLINPVDSREADLSKPPVITEEYPQAEDVEIIDNFIYKSEEELEVYKREAGLAMTGEDLLFCQEYF